MNFLKNILSTIIALIIFSVVGLFVFTGVIASLSESEKFVVKDNSILHLNLNKPITEMEVDNPFDDFGSFAGEVSSIGLVELKAAIKNAATDDKVKGIYLNVNFFMAGMAMLEEVRQSLHEFKESGKFVVAYSEYYSENAYYLASVADKVILNTEGEVELNGLNANVTFLKGTMEKFGIEPQIFRVGEFKSAVEPFIRKDLSQENELQLKELLGSMNDHMLTSIAESRSIPVERVKQISKGMEVRNAQNALTTGLVDALMYEDEVLNVLKESASIDELEMVTYSQYKSTYSDYKATTNKIAVIVASGDIVMGKGEDASVGSTKFAKLIREARLDNSVKAIVMRINSPGGAYLASDVMWRELELAKAEKPVIASMSDYAASGGYYLAMPCDTIVAQPNTITGSIGIFGMLFNLSEMLEDRLGITHDEVSTGEFSGMLTVTRSLTAAEKAIIQKSIEKNYETFVTKAAEGRGMTVEALKEVAGGRVWTGVQAKERGLVDVLGNFEDAVSIAAQKAGIDDDYKLRYFPKQKPFFEKLMEDFGGQVKSEFVKQEVGEFYPYLKELQKVKNLKGVQARMPFEMEIN